MNHHASLSLSTFRYSGQRFRRRAFRRVLGGEQVEDEDQNERDQRQAEDVAPAEGDRQARCDQRRQRRARVAGTGDPERRSLMLGRIPARGERQGDREGRAGDAEEDAEDQRLLVAVDAEVPGEEQRGDDDHLADGAGQFRLQVVNQDAHEDAQDGAGKHRRGDHHPFCACVRPRSLAICTPRGPSITQTMKARSK
jgi:hypothetical protein